MNKSTYKLIIAYDGTRYAGWQVQPNAPTIQQKVQEALSTILREQVSVTGAGRTDAGVHAMGQTAHFQTEKALDSEGAAKSLNGLLPPDIRVLNLEQAEDDFHARYSATGKVYHYRLHLEPVQTPFKRLYSLHVKRPPDLNLLREACRRFIGTHDFTSFANEPAGGAVSRNPVRTIDRLEVVEEDGGVRLEFEGKSFLYKMVRNITGVLLEAASGKFPIEEIDLILKAKDRRQAAKVAKTAPPHGLCLMRVYY